MNTLTDFIATVIVGLAYFVVLEVGVYAVCWAFGIAFDAKYAVGVWAIGLMIKTIF